MKTLLLCLFALFIPGINRVQCFCGSKTLHADLTRAVVKSSDWLIRYYRDGSSFMTPSLASSIIVSLRLYGHEPDVLLSEVKNNRSMSIKETLKNYLDEQKRDHGNLEKIPPAELALIIQGVIAICENPKDFYGYNLYSTLEIGLKTFKNSPTFNNYFRYGLAIIALCNGGVSVSKESVDELLKGANFNSHKNDFDALILMALSCVKKGNYKGSRPWVPGQPRSVANEIRKASARLAWNFITSQNPNTGDFGNQYSTGLAVSALWAANINPPCWNCEKAMRNILSYQDATGSFGTVLANIQITPSLMGEAMTSLKDLSCPKPTPPPEKKKNITVSVKLVYNDTINPLRMEPPVTVTVPEGTTTYEILELAKKQNPCYTAVYKRYSWGRSVTSICGVVRQPSASTYWLIYVDGLSAKYGVDGLKPKDGAFITFKYQKVNI